jgi:hypothetical protein
MSNEDDLRAEIERLKSLGDELAATVLLLTYDAHPVYGSTATWRGGIGGQAMTQGCSVIDPPPGAEWLQLGVTCGPVHMWLRERGELDLEKIKSELISKWKKQLGED